MTGKRIRRPHTGGAIASPFALIACAVIAVALIGGMIAAVQHFLSYRPNVGVGDAEIPTAPVTEFDDKRDVTEPTNPETKPPATDPAAVRRDGFYTFLVLGRDSVGYNTDVIMLVSFDTASHAVSAIQIPRDTYIEYNGTSHKINSLYASMYSAARRDGESDPEEGGIRRMISVLERGLNMVIDNYAIVNLQGFRNIVDLIGGVDMYVPCDMQYSDPEQNLYIDLKEGYQNLNGEKAEQFIRFRSGYVQGDIGRNQAQKLFLNALVKKVQSSISISTVTGIAGEVLSNMKTSLTLEDFVFFGREFLSVDAKNITLITFPGADARANGTSGAWYYVMNRTDFLSILNAYFNVFRADVTEDLFDRELIFTDETRVHIDHIYHGEPLGVQTYVHTSQEISEDGLHIDIYQ